MRTVIVAALCLAIGLVGGFFLGRNQTVTQTKVFVPPPAPTNADSTRARTTDMPPNPGPLNQQPAAPAEITPPVNDTASAQNPTLPSPGSTSSASPQAERAADSENGVKPLGEAGSVQGPSSIALPLQSLKLDDIHDTFYEGRTGGGAHTHEATDIMAARGTPVYAVANGTIAKLFVSKAGGNTIYQFDPTRTYCYYYAHLDHYASNVTEGMNVNKGELIGYVGSTGDADARAPHLHFAVFVLGPQKRWWVGTPVNPYPLLVQAWHAENGSASGTRVARTAPSKGHERASARHSR